MEDFNWSAAIGPGILTNQRNTDEAAFVAALKAIHPDDIFPKGSLMQDTGNHPTIHGNRFEPAGNCRVGKSVDIIDKPGIDVKEIPVVTSPTQYVDRLEQQNVNKTIASIEAALVNSEPDMSNEFVAVAFSSVLTARARDLVEKAYVDAGWASAKILALDICRSTIKLEF